MAKKEFKAESKRLLDLMINSIYTHREIFLRELISNASDAIDKLCFKSLTDENVGMNRADFRIRLTCDKDNGFLIISDNGIGMTKEDMENNLGVIARSGSLAFKKELDAAEAEKADIEGKLDLKYTVDQIEADAKAMGMIKRQYADNEYITLKEDDEIVIYDDGKEENLGLSALLSAFGINPED